MTDAKRESGYMTEEYTQTSNPKVQWKNGLPYIDGLLASYDQLVAEIERLYALLESAYDANQSWIDAYVQLRETRCAVETDETLLPSEVIGDPL